MDFNFFKTREISELAEAILGEAWTPERKAEMVEKFKVRGFVQVEHKVVGDYDLVLWRCDKDGASKGAYSVSINSGQYDHEDFSVQRRKQSGSFVASVDEIILILSHWVGEYGKMLIASVSYRKLQKYRAILSRYFLISNYDESHPDNLFYILNK